MRKLSTYLIIYHVQYNIYYSIHKRTLKVKLKRNQCNAIKRNGSRLMKKLIFIKIKFFVN